jgi:hypothetical protein
MNNIAERTQGAIYLGPTSNFQGSYKLLCLNTGRKISSKQFREFPMPEHVMKRVEVIAARDKQSGNMVFADRNGNTIGDDDDNDAVDAITDTIITGVEIDENSAAMEDNANSRNGGRTRRK